MKNGTRPDPNNIHPIAGYDKEIYVKPTIKNPNIIVGDFTYIADSEFESHVTNYYPWSRDKLIIGKFCQIAAGVEFVMNDANHQMNTVTTFPFYTLEGWGDGAIIGANSVVGSNVAPYTIVIGNPAKVLRKRFDEELTDLLLRFKWWDKSIDEIDRLIPILTCSDLVKVKEELKAR